MAEIVRRGLMLVLSSPSGAGKTTLSRALLASDSDINLSISATTRPKRPAETHGVHYFFLDEPAFLRMKDEGAFLETAHVFGSYYGTPRAPVEEALAHGRDIMFDIEWKGTQQIAEAARADLVTVFILPPSVEELERRLRGRAQDSDEVVARRMGEWATELSHWNEYDYVLINRTLEQTLADLQAILRCERLKRHRQKGLSDLVTNMIREASKRV